MAATPNAKSLTNPLLASGEQDFLDLESPPVVDDMPAVANDPKDPIDDGSPPVLDETPAVATDPGKVGITKDFLDLESPPVVDDMPAVVNDPKDPIDDESPPVLDETPAVATDPVKTSITKEKPIKPLSVDASAEGGERVDQPMHCVDRAFYYIPGKTRRDKIGLVTLISIPIVFVILWCLKDVIGCLFERVEGLFERAEGSPGRRLMDPEDSGHCSNGYKGVPTKNPSVKKEELPALYSPLQQVTYDVLFEKGVVWVAGYFQSENPNLKDLSKPMKLMDLTVPHVSIHVLRNGEVTIKKLIMQLEEKKLKENNKVDVNDPKHALFVQVNQQAADLQRDIEAILVFEQAYSEVKSIVVNWGNQQSEPLQGLEEPLKLMTEKVLHVRSIPILEIGKDVIDKLRTKLIDELPEVSVEGVTRSLTMQERIQHPLYKAANGLKRKIDLRIATMMKAMMKASQD